MIFVLSFWPHVVFYGKINFAFLIIIFRRINELNRLKHYNPSLSFFLNHTILKSKRNTNNKQKHNIVATYTFISNHLVLIVAGRNPCLIAASQILLESKMVSPHSCTFHPSNACRIPATRQALITRLGNQFCSVHIFSFHDQQYCYPF